MENQLTNSEFNEYDIRAINMDGEAWFPAKDVCDALGIKLAHLAVKGLNTNEVKHVARSNVATGTVSFPNRGMLCVNESGLYALIFKSRKAQAESFRVWVTRDVLPSIRETGSYTQPEAVPLEVAVEAAPVGGMPEALLEALRHLSAAAEIMAKHYGNAT